MVKKMTFLAGIGVGYLIGSKAGREKIKSLWNDPKVQDTVNQGTEWAKQKAPVLQDKVTDAAKDAASSAKDAASSAKSSVSSSNGGSGSGSGSGSTGGGSSAGASTVAGSSNPADRSHTSGGNSSMDPAKPQPDGR
ncbi:hypothetical protein [Arthrobacter sp. BL-252-APC-1A]|uniref:hypothetical protein n=1 Tax=Arthrobacter sp. BL-252-APC-1A TaxID=2606622 RepID=UPI0018A6B3CE|nr:hypothetical protein [Arthrobacter sp. BL-252-APC-1A]